MREALRRATPSGSVLFSNAKSFYSRQEARRIGRGISGIDMAWLRASRRKGWRVMCGLGGLQWKGERVREVCGIIGRDRHAGVGAARREIRRGTSGGASGWHGNGRIHFSQQGTKAA